MYASRTTQFIVGIFGLVGIAALSVLAFTLGRILLVAPPSYTLYAMFDNVSGLKVNDAIQIAGVKVGKVALITLSQKNERARVTLQIDEGVKIDGEAIAAIKTSGIIGDKYVSVSPGAGEHILADGGNIVQTESAFVPEDAIGQLISGSAAGARAEKNNKAANQTDSGPAKTPNNHNNKDKIKK